MGYEVDGGGGGRCSPVATMVVVWRQREGIKEFLNPLRRFRQARVWKNRPEVSFLVLVEDARRQSAPPSDRAPTTAQVRPSPEPDRRLG